MAYSIAMQAATPDRPGLLARLSAYVPADAADRARHARLTRFVRDHPDCFSRALEPGHVVASAWVVDRARRRVLLHHHKRLDRWLQFGGHVEAGDATVLEAARRELFEESGLADAAPWSDSVFDLDVHVIPASPGELEHLHYDVRFAFAADGEGGLAVSPESHALRWVPLEEVARLAPEPSLLRMVAKTAGLSPPPADARREPRESAGGGGARRSNAPRR